MSHLKELLEQKVFVVTGEVGPPKNADGETVRQKAAMLKDYVDAVNLTDNQTAIVRLSAFGAALHVLSQGVEPIMQMTCRDRNRLALQSDLLGAYSLGVRNVLCLSGDHQSFGNHVTAKNVWDIDSVQLIKVVKDMRDEALFANGEAMKKAAPTEYFIGCAANPFADPFEFRVLRLKKKINAGADFVQTQAIFDVERFERWMEMVRDEGLDERTKILAGIMPLKSARAAELSAHVAGMIIPEETIERMRKAEDAQKEGIKIALEIIERVKNIKGIAGIHIMAPLWEESIPTIVKEANLLPRP